MRIPWSPALAYVLLLAACEREDGSAEAGAAVRIEPIIYGDDDRVEPSAAAPRFAALARRHAVALLSPQFLQQHPDGTYRVQAPTYGEVESLCSGEPFAEQPAAASCSGVLVGQDIVATAAHCLGVMPDGSADCTQYRYVFGYEQSNGGSIVVSAADVYGCAEVLARVRDNAECRYGFALLRLDREVAAGPVPDRRTPAVTGEPVVVIGFPGGIPVKVDTGARVVDARSERGDYFTLNSDTFAVSSGSGVFDAQGELVGLFARGRRDFDDDGACRRVHREPDLTAPAFEEATHIGAVLATLDALEAGQPSVAADAGPRCRPELDAPADAGAAGASSSQSSGADEQTESTASCAAIAGGRQALSWPAWVLLAFHWCRRSLRRLAPRDVAFDGCTRA